ncbi:NUDIX domain-containing protein [Methylobacterium indicum]|uniref:NUDIX domain-containing protein n=1 Tax=Methylobacterium indicum TaxID=1775910 RepID=UPI000652BB6F|nr:NUDIX hydrolase [Methylobacterium indicum]
MGEDDNPWVKLGTERRYEDDFFAVEDDSVINPAGRHTRYGIVRFKNVGLRILPVDAAGYTFLVGQFRYAASYFSWELPAGGQEPDEDARACAARELEEEVGRSASSWMELLDIVPSGSLTTHRERSFVAWQLECKEQNLDEQEVIWVRRLPFGTAVQMALSGEIRDAGTITALLALHVRHLRRELPAELLNLLDQRSV